MNRSERINTAKRAIETRIKYGGNPTEQSLLMLVLDLFTSKEVVDGKCPECMSPLDNTENYCRVCGQLLRR